MAHINRFELSRIAVAVWAVACTSLAAAQSAGTVTITGKSASTPSALAGFGDTPLVKLPLQASAYGNGLLLDTGTQSLAGLTALDASVGDAYNAGGYWSQLSVRGYTLDNRFNYRRDGLPINAETALSLENKERVELLKGASGMQAGTSAPGGLVNLVTKRANGPVRSARVEARGAGAVLGAVDLGERFGPQGLLGLRLNAAFERLDPEVRHTKGERWLLALAGEAQLTPDTLLQAELEASHQRQPSVAGFSMTGNRVPSARAVDPRLNLNDQPWRQPVVMDGRTASLKLQQRLSANWQFTAHAQQQRLKSDDRTAFPYGVYDPATYDCPQWCDRFAPDGSFTYWEYVSDGERRTSRALQLAVQGRAEAVGVQHQLEAGVLFTRYAGRFHDQVFDIAGTGRIDGTLVAPPSAGFTDANTNRSERNTELFARDALRLAPQWQAWLGLRHTALRRESVRTSPASDGLRATHYEQGFTTPWLGLSHELGAKTTLYASWGQGVESEVVPNRARYSNGGEGFALKSRQAEIGFKHEGEAFDLSLALFDIDRPAWADVGACGAAGTCLRREDGRQRHRGLEAGATWRLGRWTLQGSALWLDAQRQGSTADPALNGQRPVNVPERTLRLAADWRVDEVPGLALQARLAAEGDRSVLAHDPAVTIPGFSRLDLGARWRQTLAGSQTLVWRLGVDNATDRRAWKEAPNQFGHVYLYPLAPRTWRVSLQANF